MTPPSLCPDSEINSLHQAYCEVQGVTLRMLPAHERWWFNAKQSGMTPEDIRLLIPYRRSRQRQGVRHEESMYLRNIIGSDEAIASAMEEVAMLRAKRRIKTVPPGKAEVLKATGRDATPETQGVRSVAEVIKAMHNAVNKPDPNKKP